MAKSIFIQNDYLISLQPDNLTLHWPSHKMVKKNSSNNCWRFISTTLNKLTTGYYTWLQQQQVITPSSNNIHFMTGHIY